MAYVLKPFFVPICIKVVSWVELLLVDGDDWLVLSVFAYLSNPYLS